MKKLPSTLWGMVFSLGVITCVAAAVLAYVYDVTKEPIAQVERSKKTVAISEVVPAFDNDPMTDTVTVDELKVYFARKDGALVGAAVESSSSNGFAGEISVIYGFDADGSVTGYRVIKHAETPGLGDKMDQWFHDSVGNRSVIGRNPASDNMTVSKDGGDIDAITAATISSRAFLDALDKAYKSFNKAKSSSHE